MAGTDPLDDPEITAALRIIGSGAPTGRALCPGCSRRWIDQDDELCRPCAIRERNTAHDRAKDAKARWWREQSDYGALRAKHGAQVAAERWIVHRLRKRPEGVTSRELRDDAHAAGITRMTFRRARARLRAEDRIRIERHGSGRDGSHRSLWHLTADRDQ